MSVNRVILIGNLGREPEMRYSQSGNAIAGLRIATSRKWKNKQTNEMQEETNNPQDLPMNFEYCD